MLVVARKLLCAVFRVLFVGMLFLVVRLLCVFAFVCRALCVVYCSCSPRVVCELLLVVFCVSFVVCCVALVRALVRDLVCDVRWLSFVVCCCAACSSKFVLLFGVCCV